MTGENVEENTPGDRVDAVESVHNGGDPDLHFRFIGTAKGREFVLNIQFPCKDKETKEPMRSEEYDFMIGKILGLVLYRMAKTPNAALH